MTRARASACSSGARVCVDCTPDLCRPSLRQREALGVTQYALNLTFSADGRSSAPEPERLSQLKTVIVAALERVEVITELSHCAYA